MEIRGAFDLKILVTVYRRTLRFKDMKRSFK